MSKQLEKLKQEEAELEAQMLGNPSEPEVEPQTPQEPEASTEDGFERTEEELAADEFMMDTITGESDEPQQPEEPEEQVEVQPQPQKPKRTNWKKRFTNYKSSTDATIYGLRKELMDMKSSLARIMEENSKLRQSTREPQGDLFEGAFTQEEEETFGTEGLDVVKKAAKVAIERQVKPLQEELRRQENLRTQDLKSRVQTEQETAYQQFLGRLETLVPDYADLNRDQKFLNWLKGADDFSGMPRRELLRQAESVGDVMRVADFFMDYKQSVTVVQDSSSIPESAKRHVTPVGTGGAGAGPKPKETDKGYIRQSDIDKFYSDVMKGRYAGQQDVINATERMIEEAAVERRILHNQ